MAAYQLYDTGLTVTQEDELFFYLFASIPVGFLFWDECPEVQKLLQKHLLKQMPQLLSVVVILQLQLTSLVMATR